MYRKWIEEDDVRMPLKRQDTGTDSATSTSSQTTPTSTPPTSTTSTTTSTATSSTPQSTTSTTSTSTSTTSSAAVTSTSTTSSTPTTSTRPVSTMSNGVIVTITQTLSSPSASHTASGGSKGFFDNKAQVGAVFGVAGAIALVLGFFLITTCIRRRRAKQFDRDVAEAAAAAAAANADPFMEDEDNRGASWDPRRTSAHYAQQQGYGRINDDPFGYAATGVIGRSNTGQYRGNSMDTYNMNNLSSAPHSGYGAYGGGGAGYGGGGAAYYMPEPPPIQGQEYGRPSFSSATAPGIAGVGSGGGAAGYGSADQQMRYRQQQSSGANQEDAYGGYATGPESDVPRNAYSTATSSTHPNSTPYTSPASNRLSPPSGTAPIPPSRSPPPSSSPPPPPPSYSGHEHGGDQQLRPTSGIQRPLSGLQRPLSGPPPNMPLPPTPGTPDEQAWDPTGRPLRVANE